MQKEEFKVSINAPKEKVWHVLWDDATYPEWTSAFSEGSHAETDWKEGSKIKFLDGKGSGMVSEITTLRPNEYMAFTHKGEIIDGVEDTTSDKVKSWQGALETYTLEENNGVTNLTVTVDIDEEFCEMFKEMFPKALQKLKELSE